MMMSMAGGGGMPGMPGLPGMAGKRTKSKQQAQQGRKKRGSGNPAKRAAEQKATTQGSGAAKQDGAAAFGFGKDENDVPEDFELPKELKDLL